MSAENNSILVCAVVALLLWVAVDFYLDGSSDAGVESEVVPTTMPTAAPVSMATTRPIATLFPTATPGASISDYRRDMDRLATRFINRNGSVQSSLESFVYSSSVTDEESWEIWREDHVRLIRGALEATEEIVNYPESDVPPCAEEWHGKLVEGVEMWGRGLEEQVNAIYLEDIEGIENSTETLLQASKLFGEWSDIELDC